MTQKKTFWPYGILISLLLIVCACIATIIFASRYPVYEDKTFFQSYQEVDYNINEIKLSQETFDKFFSINLDLNSSKGPKNRVIYELAQGQNNLKFHIIDKAKLSPVFQVKLLLTRPHTNKFDQNLESKIVSNDGNFMLETVLPQLEKGRWQLQLQLQLQANKPEGKNTVGFYTYEIFVH